MKKNLLILMAMFAFGLQNASAQDAPLKIVTNHPDLAIKVKRCAASGKTLVIDLIASNTGSDDVNEFFIHPAYCVAYDDEGNIYDGNNCAIGAKIANQQQYTYQRNAFADKTIKTKLLPGVPCKISLMLNNFSLEATSIALLQVGIMCRQLNLDGNKEEQRVKLRNIPVSRK